MKIVRWSLAIMAALAAVAGIVVLLLPYDAAFRSPSIAGAPGVDAQLPCKAPLVDLFTDDTQDGWINYSPDEGVTVESHGRASGEYCADSMRSRGVLGLGLVMGGVCFGAAALVTTRFGTKPDRSDRSAPPTLAEDDDRPEDPAVGETAR